MKVLYSIILVCIITFISACQQKTLNSAPPNEVQNENKVKEIKIYIIDANHNNPGTIYSNNDNINGYLKSGKYLVAENIDKRGLIQISLTNEEKKATDIVDMFFDKKVFLFAILVVIARSIWINRVFYGIFWRDVQNNQINIEKALNEIISLDDNSLANKEKCLLLYNELNQNIVYMHNFLEKIEKTYFSSILQYGLSPFGKLYKNLILTKDWKKRLDPNGKGNILPTERVHEIILIINKSKNDTEGKDIQTKELIRRTRKIYLHNKIYFFLYTFFSIE